jgi:cell division protein FtsI (penicillin-binding protein 3)
VFIALVMSFFGARLVQLQGIEPEKYATLAASTGGTVTIDLPATRGSILDRNGRPLADSVDGRMVVADPLMTRSDAPQLARFLARRLHVDYFATLKALSEKHSRFAYVARRVPASLALRVVDEATGAGYQGLATRNDPVRSYPDHDVAANLVGFMGTDGPLAGTAPRPTRSAPGTASRSDTAPSRPPTTAPTCTPPSTRTSSGTPSG